MVTDSFQLGPYQLLSGGIISAPLGKRGEHPRCYLRIETIEQKHLVAEKGVPSAVGGVKLAVVRGAESGNQGPHLVGVFDGICRVRGQ